MPGIRPEPQSTPASTAAAQRAALHVALDWRQISSCCSAHLQAEALLLETQDLMRVTHARLIYHSSSAAELKERGSHWLEGQVAESVPMILLEDERRLEAGFPGLQLTSDRAQQLSLNLGVHPDRALRACVLFNGLARESRRILFALFLERVEAEVCIERGLASSMRCLKMHLRCAAEALHGARAMEGGAAAGPGSSPALSADASFLPRRS